MTVVPGHLTRVYGASVARFEPLFEGAVEVEVRAHDGMQRRRTVTTDGLSVIVDGVPVELAVEVSAKDQVGTAAVAISTVARDIVDNRRRPPLEVVSRLPRPLVEGTRLRAIIASGSRFGADADVIVESAGDRVVQVVTLRLLTWAEANVVDDRGWNAFLTTVGSPDEVLDTQRVTDAARPTVAELGNLPILVSKQHYDHPPRFVGLMDVDGRLTFTSTTGRESPEYMADPSNREIWGINSYLQDFPWVESFITTAAPGDDAVFTDQSGDFAWE
ncbi:hypothetical protein [Tsukamurella tyrosinosolvens]|uniref:hypothetical protein n=1 Tax=Tsukamurella tyrosinosolvens TaxID=57704 RepID=UPI000791ACEC|nr:hypothetical protein [Tsukamurella tyrosinosolvens]AUN38795.1 hypothetical protein ASU32_01230 [Tsukamurella tyrosinosolvens]KXO96507.1 hypothetical protein AXK58_04210 [Tsukamurella tyrosinosolvens]